MPNLPSTNTINSAGAYDIPNLIPGRQYLLTLRTTGSATANLLFNDGPNDGFATVQDGAMLGTGPAEVRITAPSTTLRINVTSQTNAIRVNMVPLL